jgi:hypothetical protein
LPGFERPASRSKWIGPENEARERDPQVAGCTSSSNLNDSAHVVQTADDGRMHALMFYKVTHGIISGHGQPVFLAVDAID